MASLVGSFNNRRAGVFESKLPESLEDQLRSKVIVKAEDLSARSKFPSFLTPNEDFSDAISHIRTAEEGVSEGIIVSTGTERSFFDLAVSKKSKGLVIRDINPRVKAYNDFNVLLLRSTKKLSKYVRRAKKPGTLEEFTRRRSEIQKVIKKKQRKGRLSEKVAKYYKTNLKFLSRVYYENSSRPLDHLSRWPWMKSEIFDVCNYHKNEELFLKLHRYASAGNIVSTIGNINDLGFLKNLAISFIDTSNICDYSVLDLQLENDSTPRILWTQIRYNSFDAGVSSSTEYRSFTYQRLTEDEKEEFKGLFNLIMDSPLTRLPEDDYDDYTDAKHMVIAFQSFFADEDRFNAVCGSSLSKEAFSRLEKYCDTQFLPKALLEIRQVSRTGL